MRIFASALLLTSVALAQGELPSAEKVFDKYVQALGGKAAIDKHTSRYMKGTIEVPTFGASGTLEQYAKAPDKIVTKSTFEGYGDVISAFDGKTGWGDDPQQGRRDLTGAELGLTRRNADFQRALHLKEQYKTVAVTGKTKAGDREAYVVEATPPEGGTEKMFFDAENGLLLRTEAPGPESGTIVSTFSDYKDVEGLKVAHTIQQDLPNVSLVVKITELKFDVPVDDAKFAKPAK